MSDTERWTTGLDEITKAAEAQPRFKTHDEWLADRRAEWQASGSELDFDAWDDEDSEQRRAKQAREDYARAEAERRDHRIDWVQRQIPARYAAAETDHPDLIKWADHLAALDPDGTDTGPSVLIVGPTGTGKTHAAYGAARRYVRTGKRFVACITAADLYARLRPRPGQDSEEIFERYLNAQVLLVDDLGAAKSSDWTDEINYRLFNHRYDAQLPTIVTSNAAPRDLGGIVGERVASRLAEMAQLVVLKGTDRRRKAA
jgi:DNA replication protein DnaC